jgi:hypothetical protein
LSYGVAPACGDARPWDPWYSWRFTREILQQGETPAKYGINAIWVGFDSLIAAEIDRYHKLGLKVFTEFNVEGGSKWRRVVDDSGGHE